MAPQAPVQSIQKSEADVELAIFVLYLPVKPHVQHRYRPLWGQGSVTAGRHTKAPEFKGK